MYQFLRLNYFLFFVLIPAACYAQISIRVVDDHGLGVESELFIFEESATARQLGKTDPEGNLQIEENCDAGLTLSVRPISSLYFPTRRDCPLSSGSKIVVTKRAIFQNLERNAEYFEREGKHALAALIYNEIVGRARHFDPDIAEQAQEKVYDMFADFLQVESPMEYDPQQEESVMSAEYSRAVKAFQRKNALPQTGNIDYATLRTAAGTSIGRYLFTSFAPRATVLPDEVLADATPIPPPVPRLTPVVAKLNIRIDDKGAPTIEGRVYTIDELTEKLRAEAETHRDLEVTISGAVQSHGLDLQSVIEACSKAGISNVQLVF